MKRILSLIVLLAAAFTMAAQTETYTVNGVSFTMIKVEGGTFLMGCTSEQGSDCNDSEKPVHSVTVSDFWMGETEVTQALWKEVMGTTISQQRDKSSLDLMVGEGFSYPMYYVNWEEAVQFCNKLNSLLANQLPSGWRFALPTEAEWEYAARGGNKKSGYKYAGSGSIDEVAWYDENSRDIGTNPVKGKKPNALGLYDMSGNVAEWCADWYDSGYYGVSPSSNPQGPSSGLSRVLRGGGWYFGDKYCRVSNRDGDIPGYREYNSGIRLALVHR